MSKYNLIDIYEQYQIGSGWTSDFDYDGMLKTGLGTSIDTPIEVLKKIFEDFTDVNYHREAEHLSYAIDAIEIGDMMEAESRLNDFHKEIKKTMGEQDMDIEPTLGKFMASKMEEGEEVKEGRYASIDREVADRIEGFLSIPIKKRLLDAWEDLFYDLVEDEPFHMEDVLAHMSNEMGKVIDGNQMAGDRLAGIGEEASIDEEDSIEEALPKFKGVPPMKDIVKALKDDAKATDSEIKQFMASIKRAGDEYDDVDDYVEDFKNYVADKGLQEHFGRFMKDYQ